MKMGRRKGLSIFVLGVGLCLFSQAFAGDMAYFSHQRSGANFMNEIPQKDRFRMAAQQGIHLIRLAPNKWLNGRKKAQQGNFLLGRKGQYHGVINKDLDRLEEVLNWANDYNIKVVLTTLSLPGSRWRQHNNGKQERELWKDFKYHQQVKDFWQTLARRFKDHPAVVGYNILNEPSPEKVKPVLENWTNKKAYDKWMKKVKGTPADLNLFYQEVVKAIREVDRKTPIMVDSGYYATPWAFEALQPIDDPYILYAFHMYEPYQYTNRLNKGKYVYPGKAMLGESLSKSVHWDKKKLAWFFKVISDWQKKYQVSNQHIFAAEFGVFRTNVGATAYLKDLMNIFNTHKWHWMFYSFREDSWMGMDYELGGRKKIPWKYWQAIKAKKVPGKEVYKGSKMFEAIRQAMPK